MKTIWYQGLPEDAAKEVKAEYASSSVLRKRLMKILKDRIQQSADMSRSKNLYDNPNWAYLQADDRGYERALKEICEMLE